MSGRIVGGVDGSESSKDALRWAKAQADATGSELVAVGAWTYPTAAYLLDTRLGTNTRSHPLPRASSSAPSPRAPASRTLMPFGVAGISA